MLGIQKKHKSSNPIRFLRQHLYYNDAVLKMNQHGRISLRQWWQVTWRTLKAMLGYLLMAGLAWVLMSHTVIDDRLVWNFPDNLRNDIWSWVLVLGGVLMIFKMLGILIVYSQDVFPPTIQNQTGTLQGDCRWEGAGRLKQYNCYVWVVDADTGQRLSPDLRVPRQVARRFKNGHPMIVTVYYLPQIGAILSVKESGNWQGEAYQM